MKKITTLFKKDPSNLGRVTNELDPNNSWVLTDGIPTRKFDGTSVAIIDGEIYRRYDAKKGKKAPKGAIPCQEPDAITGHHPHWVKCERGNKQDQYFFEAFDKAHHTDGTYELCGEKVQGNPENVDGHMLIKHGSVLVELKDFSFESLRDYLSSPLNDIEGIVFHHKSDGRMCKIRKIDFGIKR